MPVAVWRVTVNNFLLQLQVQLIFNKTTVLRSTLFVFVFEYVMYLYLRQTGLHRTGKVVHTNTSSGCTIVGTPQRFFPFNRFRFCIQPPSVHPPSQILTCLAQSLNLFCSKLSSHCLHLYTHPRCQRNFQSLILPEEKWFGWELSDAPGGNWEPPVDVRVVRVRRICNVIRSQRMTGGGIPWLY